MSTAPVMSITEELLAELEREAKAAVPACCGEMTPTGVEYGGQREMMCCEAWQDCDITVDAMDVLALTAHIRSLSERLEKAEAFARFVKKCLVKNGEYAPLSHQSVDEVLRIGPYAIAHEGQSHE